MFPEIEMKIHEKAHLFLRQMKGIVDTMGGFETKITLEPPSESHCSSVGFSPNSPQIHEGLVGIFVNWAHNYPQIGLQIIAHRWKPEWPTYEIVKTASETLFQPVITAYNRKYRTRYRMRIESYEETLPQLSPKAQEVFNQFAHGANKRVLHTLDWERFYQFIRVCHATRNDLYDSDVAFFLRKAGFASDYAARIAEIFIHCREFYILSDWRRASSYRRRKAYRPKSLIPNPNNGQTSGKDHSTVKNSAELPPTP